MAETLDLRRAVMQCGECKQRFGADATFCPFDGTRLDSVVWDPSGDPLLGRVIDGRYEVIGVLGEGGMGIVYRVRHVALDRAFAMKALRRDLARDADLSARFTREARATAMVKHPNIVAITDFGRLDGDVPYFVMEQLVGDTLSQSLRANGPMAPALGIRIVLQIASALGAAHEAKIVHRDLKPDNIFLMGRPGGDVDVRVVDFGASMILGASRTTGTGIVFGTPHYMSPEQASGQPVDHRADIYALGVIMYEIFTGRVPFVADTYMGVLTQHMFVKPVPPGEVSEHARALGPLETVLLRLLEKRPDDRYPSMAAVAADIARLSSFATDGSLRVATAEAAAGPSSRGVTRGASAAELTTREEREEGDVSQATATTRRRTRMFHSTWLLYGFVAVGVAAVVLVARAVVSATRAGTPPAPSLVAAPPTSSPAGASPPPAPGPMSDASPESSLDSSPGPSAVSPRRRLPRPHPARPPAAGSSSRKSPSPPGSDFADPWAR